MKKFLTLSILGVALAAVPAMGAVIAYDSSAAFLASAVVGGSATATETFAGGVSSLFTFTNGGAGFSSIIDAGGGNFVRQDRVINGGYSEVVTPITGPLTAWAADFNTFVGGLGQGLNLIVNHVGGSTTVFSNINLREAVPDGLFFFGITVDGATPQIVSVTLQASNQLLPDASGELFTIDNLLVETPGGGGGPPPSVPEPSTFGLMGLAMVGLGLTRRFRA